MYSTEYSTIFVFVFLLLFLIPFILFLLTLQKTMNAISMESRRMPPSNVWLMFIPIFNVVWQFIMVDKIAQSIGAECIKLNIPTKENKPTYNIGLAWNICSLLTFIPLAGALAALVTWILYWVKVNEYKNLIVANRGSYLLDAEKNIFYGDPV